MANIYKGTLGLIGNTPLVEVIKKALQDYYERNGIDYDRSLFPDCKDCANCKRPAAQGRDS